MKKLSWHSPKLIVKETGKYGKGVFAGEDIKKEELLAVFGGHIITLTEENKLPKEYNDSGIQIQENLVISSLKQNELTDNFNHSCDPNSGIKGQIFLVAMRDIKKDEQITFDYAMCLCDNRDVGFIYNIECLCKSKNCRGFITGKDWERKDIQDKYRGYFQFYLQKKIDELHN